MSLHTAAQLQIVVLGVLGIVLISTNPRLALLGFILGLINQWAWYYTAWETGSWGVFLINIAYGVSYVRGLKNYWHHYHPPRPRAAGQTSHRSEACVAVDGS